VSDELLADLREDEGWSPFVYRDSHPDKYQTIGYGFLVDSRKGVGLPKPVAEFWLRYAVNERLEQFGKLWSAYDKQPADVQRALGNMVYQLGVSGVLAFKKMLAALEAGDRIAAAEAALDSRWSQQTPKRAKKVAALIRG
jgi:lysozyme